MTALTDLSDLVNRMTGGNNGTPEAIFAYKASRVSGAAPSASIVGRMVSLWQMDGSYGNGAAPTTVAVPTNSTSGAIPITNAGSGREKWLIGAYATGSTSGSLLVYDRLLHIGGLSGTSTADQTIQGASPSVTLTRNTGGVGNFIMAEVYTTVGTTATTLTATYTNSSGTGSRTSAGIVFGGTNDRNAQRAFMIPLASGDNGVQAVEKIKLTASTTTAGNFGIVIGKPICMLSYGIAGSPGVRDFTTGLPTIPKIDDNACLSMLWLPNATTVPEIFSFFSFVEK